MAADEISSSTSVGVTATLAYEAAMTGAAVLRRRNRRFVAVEGKAPGEMLKGILSGRIPPPLGAPVDGWSGGDAPHSAILTPKGKMVTDLRLVPDTGNGFLMVLPQAGLEGALAHFKKYLNPRFARLYDRSAELGMLTVVGPEAPAELSAVLGMELRSPGPVGVSFRSGGTGPGLWLLGDRDVHPPALDLILPMGVLELVRGQMEEAGVRPMDAGTWDALRIEAGTPLFGTDMTEDTIPVEAGIHHRVIDSQKGCYTGQEVIIRIRDRGQVNKSLLGVWLGDAEVPERGTEIFQAQGGSGAGAPGEGRKVGWITSACRSPRFGQTIALGFIKRGVGPGAEVRLGGPQGPRGLVKDPAGSWADESMAPGTP